MKKIFEANNQLFEANDDEKEKQNKDNEEKGSEEKENADDESNDDEELMSDKPFAALDLRYAHCFGYSMPVQKNWLYLAKQVKDVGWNMVDVKQLEKNLTKDVEMSYFNIAMFKLTNIDDEMDYILFFKNDKALWELDIQNSPDAEIDISDKTNFFKSDMFQKIAKKTYARLTDAKNIYDEVLKEHTEKGELLLVDDVKLMAILHFLDTELLMKNLLDGKYMTV